jgi:hypothetical protein
MIESDGRNLLYGRLTDRQIDKKERAAEREREIHSVTERKKKQRKIKEKERRNRER